MKHLILLLLLIVAGCTSEGFEKKKVKVGVLQRQLFQECLVLASKIERKSDDDVSDIVQACASSAWATSSAMVSNYE